MGSERLNWNLRDEAGQTPLISVSKLQAENALEENTLYVIAKLLASNPAYGAIALSFKLHFTPY